uniref:DUF4781 domain-containing protein n=1 Tax=Heterorhabditis bacteriophora TaxID=37862 RepID=A0A1I7X1H1_HETBA
MINGTFPQRNNSINNITNEEVNAVLQTTSRFAFADLITVVLRLDFWDDTDPNTMLGYRYSSASSHNSSLYIIFKFYIFQIENSLASTILDEQFVESKLVFKTNSFIIYYLYINVIFYYYSFDCLQYRLTGGLAAPLVAAGAGVLIGSSAVAGLATTAGAAVLGTTFGVAGAGLAGYKMKKRVGEIEEFSVESLSDGTSLQCSLVVSGWIDKDTSPDIYTLRYESKYLVELGKAIDYLMGFAVSIAIQQTLMETALAGLVSAIAWPVAIVSAASVLDNPWNVCIARSAEVSFLVLSLIFKKIQGRASTLSLHERGQIKAPATAGYTVKQTDDVLMSSRKAIHKWNNREKGTILRTASNSTNEIRMTRGIDASESLVWKVPNKSPNIVRVRMKNYPELTQAHKNELRRWTRIFMRYG